MARVAQLANGAAVMVIVLPALGNVFLFAAPSKIAGVMALVFCAAALAVSLRIAFSRRAFGYLLGALWAVLCAIFPLLVMAYLMSGPGPGRW